MPPHNTLTTAVAAALLTLALCACNSTSAPDANPAQPDFSYQAEQAHEDTGLTIAAVEPSMTDAYNVAPAPKPGAPPYVMQADGYTVEAQMQIKTMELDATGKRLRQLFEQRYQPQLQAAVGEAVEDILRNKGFAVKPVHTYDAAVGEDGSQPFLTSLPSLTLGIGNETSSENCAQNVCTQKGKLLMDGQYLYQMAEPVTGSPVAVRRMNLYQLHIEEPYTIQTYAEEPGTVAKVKQLFGVGNRLVDTSEQALVTGLNKLYQQTMAETERTIYMPQLLALRETLENLKKPRN